MNKLEDIMLVLYTNSILFTFLKYGTPAVSFITALLSLFYIIRKIKKEFYSKEK